jgi:hypothetical protein
MKAVLTRGLILPVKFNVTCAVATRAISSEDSSLSILFLNVGIYFEQHRRIKGTNTELTR